MEEIIKEIRRLQKKKSTQERKVALTYQEIAIKKQELKDICNHPIDCRTRNDRHIEGSYLNLGYYITTITCDICGTELERKETSSGYA